MKLNDRDYMRGYSDSELHEDVNELAWEAIQERESEDKMLGIYESDISVDEYQRYTQKW
jgi:hypothetical protein